MKKKVTPAKLKCRRYDVALEAETAKAYKFSFPGPRGLLRKDTWVPKSLVRILKREFDGFWTVSLPDWYLKMKDEERWLAVNQVFRDQPEYQQRLARFEARYQRTPRL